MLAGVTAWAATLILIAVVGQLSWRCIQGGADPSVPTSSGWIAIAEESYGGFLSGLALLSVCFLVLVHVGHLSFPAVAASVAGVAVSSVVVGYRRGVLRDALAGLPRAVGAGAALAVLSLVLGGLLPPLDTTLAASDSSVYLGAAHQLARDGTLRHRDPLIAEMSTAEREVLLRNRFEGDNTGRYARFPGGVPLLSPSRDDVTFYFYHLFPAWLAVGLETVGSESYLRLLGLFGCISLSSLFLIGRSLGGPALGLSVCLLHASFFPQVFFSRFPSSELLAQALFVSGLYALIRGIDGHGGRYLTLSGVLWGAFCLCRVDALPLLWLGLTTVSFLSPRMRLRSRDWGVPMLITLLIGSLAVYHQVSNGSYLGPFSHSPLAIAAKIAVADNGWLRVALPAMIAGAGFLVFRCDRFARCRTRLYAALKAFSLAPTALILGSFLSLADWDLTMRHVRWIALYAEPVLLLVLCAGVLATAVQAVRRPGLRTVGVVLAFFVGPAACYLINPLVAPLQPWAMRRFVPMIFPLFLLLALYGWQAGLRRLSGRQVALGKGAFAGLAIVAVGLFLSSSADLLGRRARAPAAPQVAALARAAPPGALVIIPDTNADLQLHIPLRFMFGRDVLLLPLANGVSGRLEGAMERYLRRQLEEGRRVILLLSTPSDLAGLLLPHFRLRFLFEAPLSWERVPFARHDVFPPPPRVARLENRVWELHTVQDVTVPGVIDVGDPREDVGIIVEGFHAPETESPAGRQRIAFRWTGPRATMAFPPARSIEIAIDTRRPPQASPAWIEVQVDGALVRPDREDTAGRQVLRIPFPRAEGPVRKRLVSLSSNTFNMKELKLSDDGRELGVRVFSVAVEP